ncbi:TatD family hydrolase [Candidatus Legionella polyplacis]|uniref:TatD family hydrolase n=1 Tax=Candidatus Legionella polyplacis TaxID=2005262 RepID=A0ABZ2H0I9_9GAMM
MLVDSHCHLHLIDFNHTNKDIDCIINDAYKNNVKHILCVSTDLNDYITLTKLSDLYKNVSISTGLHPNKNKYDISSLKEFSYDSRCIAIGETGLDFNSKTLDNNKIKQKELFKCHIKIAKRVKKPLIIHTRNAALETLEIMNNENAENIGGVIHCFNESYQIAKYFLDMNFYLSFSGIITFKNAEYLREVVKKIPINRILIETDSPYLAPEPYRGKQNYPAFLKYIAIVLGEIKNKNFKEISKKTTENFLNCFNSINKDI